MRACSSSPPGPNDHQQFDLNSFGQFWPRLRHRAVVDRDRSRRPVRGRSLRGRAGQALHHPRRRIVLELPDQCDRQAPAAAALPQPGHAAAHRIAPQLHGAGHPDYRFQWNYQPTGQVVGADAGFVTSENDRPTAAPAVGGDLEDRRDECPELLHRSRSGRARLPAPISTSTARRSPATAAWSAAPTPAALQDQQDKIVAALAALDADVVGLREVENSARFGHDRDAALRTLTEALNARSVPGHTPMSRARRSPWSVRTSSGRPSSTRRRR